MQLYIFPTVVVLVLTGCIFGCSGYSATGGPAPLVKADLTSALSPGFSPAQINEVAVMPLEAGSANPVGALDLQDLSAQLVRAFEVHTNLTLANTQSQKKFEEALNASLHLQQSGVGRAAALGRSTGVQAVVYGIVSRYQSREGQNRDAAAPSAVSFRLWLVDPASEKVLWTATYERSEQALSENLFAFSQWYKDGGGFKTAEELAQTGFVKAASEFEALRSGKAAR